MSTINTDKKNYYNEMVEAILYRNEIIKAIKMLYNFIATKWLKQYLIKTN